MVKLFKRKWHKISVAAIGIAIVFISTAAFLINHYWSPILESKVKDAVTSGTDSLYSVDFSSVDLHVVRGLLVFRDVVLKPNMDVYNARQKAGTASNNLVEIRIKKLTLQHIHPFMLYFSHKLDIGSVVMYSPELKISYQLNHTKDTVQKDKRTLYQVISKSLHSVHIGDILMGDVKFRYQDYSGHKLVISELKEMNLSAHDLLIDSATQTDRSRLLYCKDITAELNNYKGKTPDGLYTYSVKSLKLSTLNSRLDVAGIVLRPAATDVFFSKSHSDRFALSLDSARLENFDYLSYHKYRTVTASKFIVQDGAFQVFANPGQSNKKTDKIKSFPNVALDSLKVDLRIDTLLFNRLNVTYNEFNAKSRQTGTVNFYKTYGKAYNITNNKNALQKNHDATLQLSTYFMNRGKLDLDFSMNLTDTKNTFDMKGILGPMDLKGINAAAMPLAMVKVNQGKLNQFNFNIKGSNKGCTGKVLMLYNDVKVSLLKADTVKENLKKKTLESLWANIFVIKHNNPDGPGKQPRTLDVIYNRKPEDAFFKTVWRTLLAGIKPSIGFDKQTEDNIKAMHTKMAADKADRLQRKAERLKRREERKLRKGK